MLNLDVKPIQNGAISEFEDDGQVILYSAGSEQAFILNQPSLVIWKMCDGKSSVLEITKILQEHFPESEEQIKTDVINTIEQLVNNNLLTVIEPN